MSRSEYGAVPDSSASHQHLAYLATAAGWPMNRGCGTVLAESSVAGPDAGIHGPDPPRAILETATLSRPSSGHPGSE
jgi:hypothetical protein